MRDEKKSKFRKERAIKESNKNKTFSKILIATYEAFTASVAEIKKLTILY